MGEQLSQSRHELDIMPAEPLGKRMNFATLTDGLVLEKVSGLRTSIIRIIRHSASSMVKRLNYQKDAILWSPSYAIRKP